MKTPMGHQQRLILYKAGVFKAHAMANMTWTFEREDVLQTLAGGPGT